MDLETICLPPDWNAQKDYDHFIALLGHPPGSHTEALWELVRFHYDNLRATVEQTLRCAYTCDATLPCIEPSCLTSLEKIEAVLDSVRRRPQVYADPPRLLEYLEACRFAEHERARVLRDYRLAGDQAWMYPIMELLDMIGGVAADLRDTVRHEEKARPHDRKDDGSS